MALLEVRGLDVELRTRRGAALAVRDLSFELDHGQTLGLVGESGCGKSITALALMGLLPETARARGSVRFEGTELLGMPEPALCRLRGNRVAMIFQEPMTALNPVHAVGRQVAEPLRLHRGMSEIQAHREAVTLLDRVGIADAARRAHAYPHQFSGGQRQRITIAMALACNPKLLIADEPTTALDVTVQRQILDLMRELIAERSMALILISHDLGVIAQNARRTLVMYGGSVVESGPTASVFGHRRHPYTTGLFGARPSLNSRKGTRLATIPGAVPELSDLPSGCRFAGRCPLTEDGCRTTVPEAVLVETDHHVRCLRLGAGASPGRVEDAP